MRLGLSIRSPSNITERSLRRRRTRRRRNISSFLVDFINKHERLPRIADKNLYIREFEEFLLKVKRLQKQTCN